jgi:hypothetical protein
MVGRAPSAKNWTAREDRQPGPGKQVSLIVTGEVEVGRTNDMPALGEARPQGINPKILLLNLTINSPNAPGGEIMNWKQVQFKKNVSPGQYSDFTILWEGNEVESSALHYTK